MFSIISRTQNSFKHFIKQFLSIIGIFFSTNIWKESDQRIHNSFAYKEIIQFIHSRNTILDPPNKTRTRIETEFVKNSKVRSDEINIVSTLFNFSMTTSMLVFLC